jgi:hypothetical protein
VGDPVNLSPLGFFLSHAFYRVWLIPDPWIQISIKHIHHQVGYEDHEGNE